MLYISNNTVCYRLHIAVVQVIGQNGNWYKINYYGKVGFIYKAYTKVITANVVSAA